MNPKQLFNQDILFEQMATISKAHAYDILVKQVGENIDRIKELEIENGILKVRVKFLEDLISEYTTKMTVNLSGPKIDQFLKSQLSETDKAFNRTIEELK